MSKCYIPEISIKTIRREENINKLKEKYSHNLVQKNLIFSIDGYYEVKDKSITKYVTVSKGELIFENFINDYTLLINNSYDKKVENIEFIPFESKEIPISVLIFDIPESDNKLVFEYKNNRIIDFYFKTKNKITQKNIFLNNDVSLILETLNV